MPEAFWQGLEEFNRQEFYACHDTLEPLWIEANQPLRFFYQGILQLAVAYYHLHNQNWQGAVTLLGQGLQRLDYFLPEYVGVNVQALVSQSSAILQQLHQLPGQDLQHFSCQLPQIDYDVHHL